MAENDNERCKELVDKLRIGNFIEKAISQPIMNNNTKSKMIAESVDKTSTDIFKLKLKEYRLCWYKYHQPSVNDHEINQCILRLKATAT
ncbi:unnamed protein product [Adineta steineri]|uniref:Uncharacterized protein n=1 Tax=Adineta steineri TaxID=433720 RepID=A0A819TUU0_9BILA|nr:unnamed protein product [Adineta steineri]